MKQWAYYNDLDPFKCEWVRELIKAGLVTDGEVDCRDIKSIDPKELAGFTRVHMFCGIAVWDYALNLAGWGDSVVWTGSCPCPGFSAAGKGGGFGDARHLWPDWFRLIRERRPANLFGEQADDAVGFGWLDLVQTDLEAADYAVGKAVFGACSVGAPHIRQRLYFGAHAESERCREARRRGDGPTQRTRDECEADRPAHAKLPNGRTQHEINPDAHRGNGLGRSGAADGSGHADESRCGEREEIRRRKPQPGEPSEADQHPHASTSGLSLRESENLSGVRRREEGRAVTESGPLAGFWSDAIWLPCSDGKYRPTQPGLFPLAHGAPARVGRLRGYGDAIVAQQAQAFIEAWMTL